MSKLSCASAVTLVVWAGTSVAVADEHVSLPVMPLTQPPPGGSFLPLTEVNQLVFSVDGGTSLGTGGSAAAVNDGSFPDFPPQQGVTYPLTVNGFAFGWIAFGPAGTGNFDIQYTFFDTVDMTVGAAAPFYSAQLGGFRLNNVAPAWGFIQWFQDPIVLAGPITVSFPDQNWAYEVKIFDAGTEVLWAGANHGGSSPAGQSQIVPMVRQTSSLIGGSDPTYHFNDAVTQDTSLGLDQTILNDAAHTRGTVASPRHVYLKLQASIPPLPPLNALDLVTGLPVVGFPATLDCETASAISRTFELIPGEVRGYGFTLGPSGASVPAETFLDVTTSTDGADTSIALYNASGNRVAINEDDGDLLNPALSFGHGRRPSVGAGFQFDGRNGDLAGGGSFFLFIGGNGTTYGSGFAVNGASHVETGNVTLTVTHNIAPAGGDCALPTPVAPDVVEALGVLLAGDRTVTAPVGFGRVAWWTLTTDYDIQPGSDSFLEVRDISAGVGGAQLGIYDSTGNLIASGNGSILIGPGGGVTTLAADDYYLVVGLPNTTFGSSGWQARSDSGSQLSVSVRLRTPSGCPADFNADGNVDPDDLSDFITCFFLDVLIPGSCPASDFNGDGFRDPDDLSDFITAFFTSAC